MIQSISNQQKAVVVSLEKNKYAFSLAQSREILEILEITTLTTAPSYLTGIFCLRGEWIPVLKSEYFISDSIPENSLESYLFLFNMLEGTFAISCKEVEVVSGKFLQEENRLISCFEADSGEKFSFLQMDLMATEEEKIELAKIYRSLQNNKLSL